MHSSAKRQILSGVRSNVIKNNFHDGPVESVLPYLSPILALQNAASEVKTADAEFHLKRLLAARRILASRYGWLQLKENRRELKELFVASNGNIKEQKASMSRFHEIISQESRNHVKLEAEIVSTKYTVENYKSIQKEFQHHVAEYSIFERFLETVAEVGRYWRSVRDILNRYETLHTTRIECSRMLESELQEAADLRKQMLELLETKSVQLKRLCNRLILVQVSHRDARDRRRFWEHAVQRIKNNVFVNTAESLALKGGTYDLYLEMCKSFKMAPTISSLDFEAQIDFIHKTIMYYKEVATIASSTKNTRPSENGAPRTTKKKKLSKKKAK